MFMTIRTPPSVADDFIPLDDYQSRTPESFFDGKAVLHYHVENARVWRPAEAEWHLPPFPRDGGAEPTNPRPDTESRPFVEYRADVFVGSDYFTIFNSALGVGVQIPYPSISMQALSGLSTLPVVWMEIVRPDSDADEDAAGLELTICPPSQPSSSESMPTDDTRPPAKQLYDAMTTCSDLHPDPVEEDDEDENDDYITDDRILFEDNLVEGFTGVGHGRSDGGLPPPFPGSSGWITAENLHEYFDEEGNWIVDGTDEGVNSGEGSGAAGRVRGREEMEKDGRNGHADEEDDSEAKRPRVD